MTGLMPIADIERPKADDTVDEAELAAAAFLPVTRDAP